MCLCYLIIPPMHIRSCAGRRVALLNRAALIDRCVFCGKPALLIVSFPVASSLTYCLHQQMHMLAGFGRSICARSSSSQGLCIIRLAACLSCLVCMRACEIRLVSFPCRPLIMTIISLCSAFINASHLNCVCRCPRRQIFSHVLVLNKLRCCGLLFEVASSVASSSCIRVVFPRRGREAPFAFAVCLLTRFHSCKPILVDLWFDSRSALLVSIDTKIGRDNPFCFPCVWRCLRPVVLLLCTCGCLV